MKKLHIAMAVALALPAYHVKAHCHFESLDDTYYSGHVYTDLDYIDILFDVNNSSDKWMYLWMGHPNHGEDNGNLNLKPHSSARAIGCSNGAGYAVNGIILTQGKKVLYTFDVNRPWSKYGNGYVTTHTWEGGCYVAWDWKKYNTVWKSWPVHWHMSKMEKYQAWGTAVARVRIDCV